MPRPMRPEDLALLTFVADARISPDGSRVLVQRKTIADERYETRLTLVDAATGEWRDLTRPEGGAGHGRWSPDGSIIAFLGERNGKEGIHLLPLGGGEPTLLRDLGDGSIGGFEWSPDGSRIALAFRPTHPDFTDEAKKARGEKKLPDLPWVTESAWYRLDGDGYFGEQRYRLLVLDAKTGETVTEYAGDPLGNYTFSWHPTGGTLIVAHSARENPLRETPNDQLHVLSPDGTARRLPGLPTGEKQNPRYSPDGRWIAYAGDVDERDPWGVRNTKLYLVPAEGGEPRDLTGHTDLDLAVATLSDTAEAAFDAWTAWAPDGSGLYVQVGTRGEQQVGFVPVEGGVRLVTEGRWTVQPRSLANGVLAATLNHPTQAPEVALVDAVTGEVRKLTGFNDAFHAEVECLAPEPFEVESTEGARVHGWVLGARGWGVGDGSEPDFPSPTSHPRKLPVCLNIHGGPHTQYGWAFFHELQVQAAAGYAVVYPNPRGSKGYGEAWCAAIYRDWGRRDWEDVQAVTDWIVVQAWADARRVAIMGGSYGGYMTCWAIGHTDRYRCAITDRCVSNLVSMSGDSDFPFNKDGYFQGHPDGDLEAIRRLWEQSPLAFFDRVTTPTLVVHSEGDLRCNVSQGEQVFTSLQQRGVPSRFVIYPVSTSHGLSRSGPPSLRLHRLREYLAWLGRWMG